MTTGFSNAAGWLQNVSGADPSNQIEKKDEAHDPVLRDLRAMKDAETKDAVHPPPRNQNRASKHLAGYSPVTGGVHQPKPKFVAHKAPTQSKKGKAKQSSDRLGGSHMA